MINKTIISEFIELVKTDVQSKNERKIAELLKKKLNDIGCEVFEDFAGEQLGGNTGNIIARLKGNSRIPAILFSAHMDRVNNGNCIKPIIEDDKIRSDGTTILAADDVAGIVSILDGLRRVVHSGIEHGDIEVVFTVCEEQGIQGSRYLDFSQLASKIGYIMDSPGPIGRIVNQAPGKVVIKIEIKGKAAHAGNEPEKGINAIKVAACALSEIEEGRLNEFTTSNFGIIKGGNSTNVVCDFLEIVGEVRSIRQEEIDNYIKNIKARLDIIAARSGAVIELKTETAYDTFHIDENEKIIKILKSALERIGAAATLSRGGGGLDANRYNKKGIAAVGVATGYEDNHTLKEVIDIQNLIKAGELVQEIVAQAAKL